MSVAGDSQRAVVTVSASIKKPMKLPRLRTVLLTPLALFALLYIVLAVKLAADDDPIATAEGPLASHETIAIFGASGFSQKTWAPDSNALIVNSACVPG